MAALARGTEVRLRGASGGFVRAALPGGKEGWIPDGSFERAKDREERKRRAKDVADFPAQPGRVIDPTQLFLAPDYGGAMWGQLEDGDDVEVVLADHDFYGVRLPGKELAFVPARSVRLLPPRAPHETAENRPEPPPPPGAEVEATLRAGAATSIATPVPESPRPTPFESLPAEAEAPVLLKRVDPKYPDFARKAGLSGDVTLKVLVEADGHIARVDVVTGAPGGLTEAATEAVRKWVYQPARVAGRPVAVWKVLRVHFALGGREPPGEEKPPL